MDASGALSIAERGTVLAEARTQSFDVMSHENYVAPGLDHFCHLTHEFSTDTLPRSAN